jgi:hypothetical protein
VSSLFCRHNRFTAECPICSKGSVLSREAPERQQRAPKPAAKPRGRGAGSKAAAQSRTYMGPNVSVGPFERDARIYEVKLEKVPGGLRLAEWRGGGLERRAPALPGSAVRELVDAARERGIAGFAAVPDEPADRSAEFAASPGRAGDMQEELRLERLPDPGFVRIARWIFWPGGGEGWQLQDSPILLPEQRFEQVFSAAARAGLI